MQKTILTRQVFLDILIYALFFAVLGMVFGIMISGYQEPEHSLIDPTAYDDLGLFAGLITGLLSGAIIYYSHMLFTHMVLKRQWFSLRLFLLFSGITGLVAGLAIYFWLISAAPQYDMKERVAFVVLIDAIITGALGTGFGVILGIIFAKIRELEKR